MFTMEGDDATTDCEYVEEIAYIAPDIETTCGLCQAEFLDTGDLHAHVQQVHEGYTPSPKTCQFCEVLYTDLEDYARHIRDSHLTNLKYCRCCTKCFTDLRKFNKHVSRHYKSGMFSCSQCHGLFTTGNEVKIHEVLNHDNSNDGEILKCMPHLSLLLSLSVPALLHSENMDLVCKSCNFKSLSYKSYLKHFEKRKCETTIFACDKCGETFKSRGSVVKHFNRKRKCFDVEQYASELTKCPTCKIEVHSKQMLAHLKLCKVYKCNICDIRFQEIDELSAHQSAVHPVEIDVTKCKYCTKEYVGSDSLKKHIERSHVPTFHLFKYQCKTCEAIFKHPQNLFAHYFTRHKDLEPYTCKICNLKFKIRKRLTIHIKMKHNGEGVVEFDDQYHVFFTEKKSEKPFIPKCVIPEEELKQWRSVTKVKQPVKRGCLDSAADISESGIIELLISDEDEDEDDSEHIAVEALPLQNDVVPKKKMKIQSSQNEPAMSSSDEEPLVYIKKRAERTKFPDRFSSVTKKTKKIKEFTCRVCNKYCYTYQNFHNHVKIHSQNEPVECVKCSKSFRTEAELTEHVTTDHATSKLTETLKSLRERKQVETQNVSVTNDTSSYDDETDSTSRFMKTIKRVKVDKPIAPAKITIAPNNISAKKFIENFVPDVNETAKELEVDTTSISIKTYNSPFYRKHSIKMTKFTPEEPLQMVKLKMPVKFQEDLGEKVKINIKLVHQPERRSMFESFEKVDDYEVPTDNFQDYDHFDKNESIPEVAHEIMLEGTEEPPRLNIQAPQKIVIPKLPKGYSNIHIATLQSHAPFFKIIKVKGSSDEPIVIDTIMDKELEQPIQTPDPPKDDIIRLSDGTKFVTANPLAHLLGDTPMDKVLEPIKNKHYKPTITNFKGLFAEALQNLDKPTLNRKIQKKKKKLENN